MTRRKIILEDHQTTEIQTLKSSYENEKQNLKDAIEELSKKYKDLKQTADGLIEENENLQKTHTKLHDKINQNQTLEINRLKKEKIELNERILKSQDESRNLNQSLEEIESRKETMSNKIQELYTIQDRTKEENIGLQNKFEELSNKVNETAKEMEVQIKEAKLQKSEEIKEVKSELEKAYDNKMRDTLKELRDIHESNLQEDKQDFKDKYDEVIQNLMTNLSEEKFKNNQNLEDFNENIKKIVNLETRIAEAENREKELKDKEKTLEEKLSQLQDEIDPKVSFVFASK